MTHISPLQRAQQWLKDAPNLLLGAGAGLSAAGGLNYGDPAFFAAHYHGFEKQGFKTVWEAVRAYWDMTPANREAYWGFWATHINIMYYQAPATTPYQALSHLLQKKHYFIITTNVDGQFHKLGLEENRMFIPQGEYGLCQCPIPCHEQVYNNKEWISRMLAGMDQSTVEVRQEDIPCCPQCGAFMVPNLRKDEHFVDVLYHQGYPRYQEYLRHAFEQPMVLLELGVGFNTPTIIRYAFERMVEEHPRARLIRVNNNESTIPANQPDHAVGLSMDINDFLLAMGAG